MKVSHPRALIYFVFKITKNSWNGALTFLVDLFEIMFCPVHYALVNVKNHLYSFILYFWRFLTRKRPTKTELRSNIEYNYLL